MAHDLRGDTTVLGLLGRGGRRGAGDGQVVGVEADVRRGRVRRGGRRVQVAEHRRGRALVARTSSPAAR